MIIIEDIPEPKEAQLNCSKAFESFDCNKSVVIGLALLWVLGGGRTGLGSTPSHDDTVRALVAEGEQGTDEGCKPTALGGCTQVESGSLLGECEVLLPSGTALIIRLAR